MPRRRRVLVEALVGPLLVVLVSESIEVALLSGAVRAHGLDHLFSTPVLPMPDLKLESPERVLERALQRKDAMDYGGVVELCDHDSMVACLNEFREAMRPPTERDMRDRFPHLTPDEIPRWLRAALKDHQRKLEQIPLMLGEAPAYARLLELTPEEFFGRMLEGKDPRGSLARWLRMRGVTPPPVLTGPLPGIRYEVLPAVPTAPSEVRVSYRVIRDRADSTDQELEHEALRGSTNGGWRLVARRDLLQQSGNVFGVIDLPPDIVALLEKER